jgi:hypothetical protein
MAFIKKSHRVQASGAAVAWIVAKMRRETKVVRVACGALRSQRMNAKRMLVESRLLKKIGINCIPCLTQGKLTMTSTTQTELATVATTAQTDQPSVISTAPAPSAPAPSAPAPHPPEVKAVAKKVAKTSTTKVAEPVKAVARVAVKPVASKAATKAAAKPVVKAAPTAASKAAVKRPAKAEAKTVIVPTAKHGDVKPPKEKKLKLVRDSFTMPKLEYLKLDELKQRGVTLGNSIKKSELIRAGIMALAAMSDANFRKAMNVVPVIKTGRPAKDRS